MMEKELKNLVEIVEGIKGSMEHGTWRDDRGRRLKDTPEWVSFYLAVKNLDKQSTDC